MLCCVWLANACFIQRADTLWLFSVLLFYFIQVYIPEETREREESQRVGHNKAMGHHRQLPTNDPSLCAPLPMSTLYSTIFFSMFFLLQSNIYIFLKGQLTITSVKKKTNKCLLCENKTQKYINCHVRNWLVIVGVCHLEPQYSYSSFIKPNARPFFYIRNQSLNGTTTGDIAQVL